MTKEGLALVDATHGVKLGSGNTICRRINVVGNDHSRPRLISLIKAPQLPEVALALRKLPLSVEGRFIERGQGNSPGAALLVFDQGILQLEALLVLPAPVSVPNLFNHTNHGFKRGSGLRVC